MGELRDAQRLALEACNGIGIAVEMRRQNLDGDLTIQPGIARPVDVAHTARPERRDDFVRPEPFPGRHEVRTAYTRTDDGRGASRRRALRCGDGSRRPIPRGAQSPARRASRAAQADSTPETPRMRAQPSPAHTSSDR